MYRNAARWQQQAWCIILSQTASLTATRGVHEATRRENDVNDPRPGETRPRFQRADQTLLGRLQRRALGPAELHGLRKAALSAYAEVQQMRLRRQAGVE